MRLKELIKSLDNINSIPALEDFEVGGISCDSREVSDNFVFVAVRGSREDGNRFIEDAIERGAKAVVVQSSEFGVRSSGQVPFIKVKDARKALAKLAAEFYEHPSLKMKVVGVTGTNGKTTVSYLLEEMLKAAHRKAGVIGTINYRFKEKRVPAKNTTPGPIELESLLGEMLRNGAGYCLMEVSSHALDQDRTEGIDFHSAIFTNLTQDHLDYHKTEEKYFKAKAKLFKGLSPKSFAVINNDDRFGRRIRELTRARIITYAIESDADIIARDIKFGFPNTEFKITSGKQELDFKSRLLGRYNLYNILASVAWGREAGIDMSLVKSAIERFSFVPGRMERIDFAGDFSVFVDYAHTEDALKNALGALRAISRKRIIVVFGCGGERDRAKRPKMGKIASELADHLVITSDNPRSEDPQEIIKDITRGIEKSNYCVIPERLQAIKKSLSLGKKGDIILVAGKGHEDYQVVKDRIIPFDDREVIKECLRSKSS